MPSRLESGMRIDHQTLKSRQCGWRRDWLTSEDGTLTPCGHHFRCLRNGTVTAELQIHRYPDKTWCLVVPDEAGEDHELGDRGLLLAEAVKISKTQPARFTRCLSPPGSGWDAALRETGFQLVDRLNLWQGAAATCFTESKPDGNVGVLHVGARRLMESKPYAGGAGLHIPSHSENPAAVKIDREQLRTVLSEILSEDDDVPTVPRIDAESLMTLLSLIHI